MTTASEVISKTDEPQQLRQARHRQQPRMSSALRTSRSSSSKRVIVTGLGRHQPRRTSRSSSGKRVIANSLGRHHQDGRATAAPAIVSSPSFSDGISKTDEPKQLSQDKDVHTHLSIIQHLHVRISSEPLSADLIRSMNRSPKTTTLKSISRYPLPLKSV